MFVFGGTFHNFQTRCCLLPTTKISTFRAPRQCSFTFQLRAESFGSGADWAKAAETKNRSSSLSRLKEIFEVQLKRVPFWGFLMILLELGHLGQHAPPGNPWGDACKRRRWITSAFRTQKICDLRRATAWNLGPSHSAAFSRLFCRRQTCWCAMRAACEQRTIFGCTARSNRYAWAWLIAFHSLQSWYFAVSNSYTHPSTFRLERSIFILACFRPLGSIWNVLDFRSV